MAFDLDGIGLENVHRAQQAALVRLQLYVLGQVHLKLGEASKTIGDALRGLGADAVVTAGDVIRVRRVTDAAVTKFSEDLAEMISRGMFAGGAIAMGTAAVYHREMILNSPQFAEGLRHAPIGAFTPNKRLQEAVSADAIFTPQLRELVLRMQGREYADNLRLSARIWRQDVQTRQEIARVLSDAIANGRGAYETAASLEQYLGAGANCPRWTQSRLNGLTKAEIASGDRLGLFTGDDCKGQGVSYNALRLARTEIQAAHHAATTDIFKRMPWIEKERVNLSPEHDEIDECDDVIADGEDGEGTYPIGSIFLPIHPNCLCYFSAVLMPLDDFTDQLRGWMQGTRPWAAMDEYEAYLGGDMNVNLEQGIGLSMASWLYADARTVGDIFWQIALRD